MRWPNGLVSGLWDTVSNCSEFVSSHQKTAAMGAVGETAAEARVERRFPESRRRTAKILYHLGND